MRDTIEDAEGLALRALAWTLAEPDRAMRLLSVTGLTPDDLRGRAGEPAVQAAIIGFLESHEPDLIACADALAGRADIVILTNLADQCRQPRIDQLARFGIAYRVDCNTGGKGTPVARLVEEHGGPVTVFVDDLAVHHDSVARHAPHVHRLHMVSEPELAPTVLPAPAAHARIDDWRLAQTWIADRFDEGKPAEA